MLPRIPITMTARPKLQLHQIVQISLLICLNSLLQLLPSSFDSSGSGDGGRHSVISLGEPVTPGVFLGETVSGTGDGELNLLGDLQVLVERGLCLAPFLVETGDLSGGVVVSLLSRLASRHIKKETEFLYHVETHDMH